VTQSDVDQANETVGELQSLCASAGQTISAASLTAASGAATASSGGASASDVSASIPDASFTSASGGLTIGGGAGSGASTSGVAITSSAVCVPEFHPRPAKLIRSLQVVLLLPRLHPALLALPLALPLLRLAVPQASVPSSPTSPPWPSAFSVLVPVPCLSFKR